MVCISCSGEAAPQGDSLLARASGIALVEVLDVTEYDLRGADGNAGVIYKLKRLSGTGEFRTEIRVVVWHGGLGIKPSPSLPLKPDSFRKGDRFWVVFASKYDWDHNQGVLAFWSENAAPREMLERSVKSDLLKWQPQYQPKLQLSIGRLVEQSAWRIRAERDGKPLWEQKIDGAPTDAYAAWGLYPSLGDGVSAPMPTCGQVLFAETHTKLTKDNEFELPPGPYYVKRGFDPETGKLHAAIVRLAQGPSVVLVERDYDSTTGKPTCENRYDSLPTGGKAAGGKTENWYRKTTRTFDAAGKVVKEEIFRYDDATAPESRWAIVR